MGLTQYNIKQISERILKLIVNYRRNLLRDFGKSSRFF